MYCCVIRWEAHIGYSGFHKYSLVLSIQCIVQSKHLAIIYLNNRILFKNSVKLKFVFRDGYCIAPKNHLWSPENLWKRVLEPLNQSNCWQNNERLWTHVCISGWSRTSLSMLSLVINKEPSCASTVLANTPNTSNLSYPKLKRGVGPFCSTQMDKMQFIRLKGKCNITQKKSVQ